MCCLGLSPSQFLIPALTCDTLSASLPTCWLSTSWPQLWPKRSAAANSHSPLFNSVMGETSRLSWNKPYLFQPSPVLHSLCKIASKDAWTCCIMSLFINYVLTSAFKLSLVRSWLTSHGGLEYPVTVLCLTCSWSRGKQTNVQPTWVRGVRSGKISKTWVCFLHGHVPKAIFRSAGCKWLPGLGTQRWLYVYAQPTVWLWLLMLLCFRYWSKPSISSIIWHMCVPVSGITRALAGPPPADNRNTW